MNRYDIALNKKPISYPKTETKIEAKIPLSQLEAGRWALIEMALKRLQKQRKDTITPYGSFLDLEKLKIDEDGMSLIFTYDETLVPSKKLKVRTSQSLRGRNL